MNTNHTPLDTLDKAEAAVRDLPAHVTPSAATLDRIAALAAAAEAQPVAAVPPTSTTRSWRRKAMTVLLASAASVLAIYGLMHTPQTSFAFEDVVNAVRKADTVSYTTVITPKNGPASQIKNFSKGTLTRSVFSDGSYSVMDMAGQRMLMVQPGTKSATVTQLGNKAAETPTMGNSIISWLKTAEATGKPVGDKTIDGVRTLGFEASFGAITMTIWSNPRTKLPVQIDSQIGAPSEPIQTTMRDFVFDAPLDDALFSTEPPAGYEVRDVKQPTIDLQALAKLPPEVHVVRILKFYAGLNDGAFPERIDGPELIAKLTARTDEKQLEDPAFLKEFSTLAGSMGATWTFRMTLNKFGYLGTAKLGDKDRIVFWYLPKDAEKYRVVYADLSTGDVAEDKLPPLPTE
jgi:outer membrane lipoprotein-sorting protein